MKIKYIVKTPEIQVNSLAFCPDHLDFLLPLVFLLDLRAAFFLVAFFLGVLLFLVAFLAAFLAAFLLGAFLVFLAAFLLGAAFLVDLERDLVLAAFLVALALRAIFSMYCWFAH